MGLIGGFVAFIVVVATIVIVVVMMIFAAIARGARATTERMTERIDSREGRRLEWSCPVDDLAKALIADQAVYFWVDHRRALRCRHVHYLLVPLTCVRMMGPTAPETPSNAWHLWQSSSGHGCTVRVPASGWERAHRLALSATDVVAVHETLDALMHRVHDHRWGDTA